MLKELAQEMLKEQKLKEQELNPTGKAGAGAIVRRALSRGLILTLSDCRLSMTRENVAPSPVEERLVLEAFGVMVCNRREWTKCKWHVIAYFYLDPTGKCPSELAFDKKFCQVMSEPLPQNVYTTYTPERGIKLHYGKPPVKQGELFSVPTTSRTEYYS